MKTKKLIRKIKVFLNAKRRAQLAEYESLLVVVAQLEKKAKKVRAKLSAEDDKERIVQLKSKLKVIEAQRKKGAKLIRVLEELQEKD